MDSVSGSVAARSATVSLGRRLALAVAAVVVAGVALLVSVQTFSASKELRETAENGTLTLSERWLTTQTSSSLRAATATGSRPTGMEARCCRP